MSFPRIAGISLRDDPYDRAGLPAPRQSPSRADGRQPGGLYLNLGYADENVVGYDHPQTLIFRNVGRLSDTAILEVIESGVLDTKSAAPLMLSEEAAQIQRTVGGWSEVFDREGWPARVPGLAWLLVVELICLAAFPFTWWLMRPLPDRGILFARVLGLLLVAWVAWMLVSLGVLRYSAGTVWLALCIAAIPSALVLWRQWQPMLDWVRQKWRLVVTAEALFLLAYIGFLMIRAANPDLWHPWRGGEKPMELAYFTAVTRSVVLPPYDPWFAGGYLNYYYWGYFILSAPVRLTGIPPATAFNLAVPLLFALTTTGVGSLVYNLIAAARGRPDANRPQTDHSGRRRRWIWIPGGAALAGCAAAAMATIAGNLDGAVQLIQLAQARLQGGAAALSNFDFWASSRAIPVLDEFEPSKFTPWIERRDWLESGFHITEFPFFTFLFADLHAHMMTMPFAVLALALGLSLLLGLATRRVWRGYWPWIVAVIFGLAVGSLWAINSWEYPAYALLMMGVCAGASWMSPGSVKARLLAGGGLAMVALLVSYAAFWPFHASTETFGTGIEPTRWRTPITNYLLIHGLLLLGALGLLAVTLPAAWAPLVAAVRTRSGLSAQRQWTLAGVALGMILAIYLWVASYVTAGFLTVLVSLTAWALVDRIASRDAVNRRPDTMALAMLALALAVGIGVELVRVEGDIARMNTVFKYYLVAWLLFSIVAGYGFWRWWQTTGGYAVAARRGSRIAGAGLVALVATGVLVYPVLATPVRLDDRFGDTPYTLDGAAWMATAVHWEREVPIELGWDAEAIRWMQDNVAGTPVVLEAHGDQYRWNGRFSVYTGLPTVLGWPWHQVQQRNNWDGVRQRARDVETMYNSVHGPVALGLLEKYAVAYIVVGDLERIYYDPDGIDKFERMASRGEINLVFENKGTLIYTLAGR